MTISIIAAVAENRAIGNKGKLPWHLPADLKHFKEKTIGNSIIMRTVIMGANTFESIGSPLNRRMNIVFGKRYFTKKEIKEKIVFKRSNQHENLIFVREIEDIVNCTGCYFKDDLHYFVIGGAKVYEAFLSIADTMYITKVCTRIKECDTFFPTTIPNMDSHGGQCFDGWHLVESTFREKDEANAYDLYFNVYKRLK